jgi:DNA-binding beta-propeller fold protein YncE
VLSKLLRTCAAAALGALVLLPAASAAQEGADQDNPFRPRARQLLYVTLPGTLEQAAYRNGLGIVVLDVNDGYSFVKRIPTIDIPASMSPEQVAGVAANPATNLIYLAYRGRLAAFDLATDRLVWSQTYDGKCCERPEVTADGKTIVVGSDLQDYWYVVDAKTGKLRGTIKAPNSPNAHNLNLSPDGKTAFMSPNGPVLAVGDIDSMKLVKEIRFTDNVRPFVVNHDASLIYANTNNLLGFEVADVKTGKIIKHVEVNTFPWREALEKKLKIPHGCPSHGIALVNNETEVWIADGINGYIHIFDNTKDTPQLVDSIKTTEFPAWITIGLDGKYAYVSSGDIIDTKTRKIVGQMKDEYGRLMRSEKLLDMTFRDGKLQRVADQFGNGQTLSAAGVAAAARK